MKYPLRVSYVADGETSVFNVPFSYQTWDAVMVTVGRYRMPFDWVTPQSIQLRAKPAQGSTVTIERNTALPWLFGPWPSDASLASWMDNVTYQQILSALQEVRESLDTSVENTDGQ